jgi:hypothetical protein
MKQVSIVLPGEEKRLAQFTTAPLTFPSICGAYEAYALCSSSVPNIPLFS